MAFLSWRRDCEVGVKLIGDFMPRKSMNALRHALEEQAALESAKELQQL
jgi:hypothetical protein